ncbi:MAG: phosphoribosylglycinamide formyltransferase [Gammaproteobacteria bacterium]|nr:phosphoribosylglycinamide formyltransferase [Gammaproteobacteria bacterium]
MNAPPRPPALPLVVLISGRGSNLQSIIDAHERGALPVEIRSVISNRPGAPGLERARRAGIATRVLDHKTFPDRQAFDRALMALIDAYDARLVVLAGFMRVLGPEFVRHYQGRLLNIHPSLLPALRGLHTHERALRAGLMEHGASVHFVTDDLDGGPVIVQARVPVLPGDDAERLAARVLAQEHRIYPLAIRWFVEGRLRLDNGRLLLDGAPLPAPVVVPAAPDTTAAVPEP